MYGSDYLLGLSTFAPDLFAKRDAMWAAGDPGFYELNDLLAVPGVLRVPPAGAGVQAQCRPVPEAPRLDRVGRAAPEGAPPAGE